MKLRFTFINPNNPAYKHMHTGKMFSASCFYNTTNIFKKLQMTPSQDNGDVKAIDLARWNWAYPRCMSDQTWTS